MVRVALVVAGVWVAAVWAVGALYVAMTLVESAPYVPSRSPLAVLRFALREYWLVMWTQPLLPLFQFVGRRMGTGGGEIPVVLLHGYFQNRVDFVYLARRLRAAGSGPLYACNFFWPQPLEGSSASVRAFVNTVMRETGATHVNLVAHSSGGLLAMDLVTAEPGWVRSVVVIAMPWRGVTWPGPVIGTSGEQLRAHSAYADNRPDEIDSGRVLSIFSAHDNVVHPVGTSQVKGAGVKLHEVENLGHLAILFDRGVGDAVCEFLLASRG